MLKKKIFLFIMLILLSSNFVLANILVTKSGSEKAIYGDNIKINILIKNEFNSSVDINVRETIVNAEVIDKKLISQDLPEGMKAAIPPYLEWNINTNQNSEQTLSYTIRPKKVGTYTLSPTMVTLKTGEKYFSNSLDIEIGCNNNNVCQSDIGENYLTCQDCKTGDQDNICNPDRDSICDPDCVEGIDLDCKISGVSLDSSQLIVGVIIIIAIIGGAIYFTKFRKVKKNKGK